MKQITVVIPVYNGEAYIVEAVQSVLSQTYSNLEILIIDDGSQDGTLQRCRQFNDARIRILQQPNRGPAAARNLGIRHATGEYIAFLDGDDRWHPEKLAKHAAHLDRNPGIGVSVCPSALIDQQGQPLGIYQISKLRHISVLDLLCRTPIGNGSVPVMRRETLQDIQFYWGKDVCYFNPDRLLHPSEDVECWVRIAVQTNWKIEGIPEVLTDYRVNSKGCSADILKKWWSWEYLLREIGTYSPETIATYKDPAMAYQLRHLARRAVALRDGALAYQLIVRSLKTYPQMLKEEAPRTLQTLLAAAFMQMLPRNLYERFESLAMQVVGYFHQRRIARQCSQPTSVRPPVPVPVPVRTPVSTR